MGKLGIMFASAVVSCALAHLGTKGTPQNNNQTNVYDVHVFKTWCYAKGGFPYFRMSGHVIGDGDEKMVPETIEIDTEGAYGAIKEGCVVRVKCREWRGKKIVTDVLVHQRE